MRRENKHYLEALRIALESERHWLAMVFETTSETQREWVRLQLLGNRTAFHRLEKRERAC